MRSCSANKNNDMSSTCMITNINYYKQSPSMTGLFNDIVEGL